MKKELENFSPSLYNLVKRKIDLSEFLSTEIGCNLMWNEAKISAKTACPMPSHKDANPSFRIKFIEEDSLWIYNCFGCGSKGTIVDFCMEYYGIDCPEAAVLFLCDKFSFKKSDALSIDGFNNAKKRVNLQKKINCTHVVASRQCFSLLKKDYSKYNKWVADAYKSMNKALDEEDLHSIESIGFEASNKILEK